MKFRFVFWDVLPCKIIVVSEVRAASINIALMMEAAHTSETSVTIILQGSISQKTNLNSVQTVE
jgi:hypothetical protein